jgi:hypothetical protein
MSRKNFLDLAHLSKYLLKVIPVNQPVEPIESKAKYCKQMSKMHFTPNNLAQTQKNQQDLRQKGHFAAEKYVQVQIPLLPSKAELARREDVENQTIIFPNYAITLRSWGL